ncbi:FAD-dependent oxidoreductase [Amycolatopsis pithecellobii]|uniref:FAD-dependent oxidoreductase n=1 Tax=Amycolatopsis pithecellobii TaxID=664692 RepID=A0A6N7Z239_9PSEU|nr:FAD-dependent oxidoreductase [Amycolatopsis pithecellobii]MTD55623.1 FAD-dependent oxidoreductase [Amycolatopsis pithecellobii]
MNVLVVGAGIAGLATAIALAEQGMDVELVERRAQIQALGSGITLIGPALRALERLGVVEQCVAAGYGIRTFQTLNVDGTPASKFDLPSPAGSELPGMLGMMRPALHAILLDRAAALGVTARGGTELASVHTGDRAAEVTLTDGSGGRYDLVVGADGVRSATRDQLFGPVPLVFRGQGCIRAVVPRPAQVTGEIQYRPFGDVFIGFTPTGEDSMYMFCSYPVEEDGWPTPPELVDLVLRLTEPFGGFVPAARAEILDPDQVNLAKFSTVLAPEPWTVGRAVILGDAAHCPTPQLAAGAAMCLEDAVALAEELDTGGSVEAALVRFSQRRYDRCRFVVETSCQLAHWQTYPNNPDADHERVTAEAFERLARPF